VTTVSVVIPNFNGERLLGACLEALRAQTRPPDEILVVDNGSSDGSLALLRRFRDVTVRALDRNRGFAGASNRGVQATGGELVAVLNSDARPEPGWLATLLAAPVPNDVWQWGGVLLTPDGRVESAGDQWHDDGYAYKLGRGADPAELPDAPYPVFAAPGAAPLMRRAIFDELGGYCERFFLYYEDVDLAYRALLRGYRALVVPAARVVHELGGSGTARQVRFHVARNSWWTAARCVPDPRPLRIARRALHEARAHPSGLLHVELAGRAASLAGLPRALAERRRIQAARVLEPAAVREHLALTATATAGRPAAGPARPAFRPR
jgi:GT2 family glycosyltransferase